MKKSETMKVQSILLSAIDRPAVQDRLSIDPEYIKELASSIAEIGLISPIVLCPREERYEIVSGDCRYQAFASLGRETIPAFVQSLDAETISISRATENLQRKDLTAIEEGQIYRKLHDDYNMSWDQIAKRTGKTPGLVQRRCELLRMPAILVKAVHEKRIGYGIAEDLCKLKNLGRIEYWLSFAIDDNASRRTVQEWVNKELYQDEQPLSTGGGGGWGSHMPATKPVYVPCDLCQGPLTIGTETRISCCPECVKKLSEVLK